MDDILKTFNTADTWVDVATLAKLKGISERGVRLSIKKYDYKEETVRGGKCYKIRLSSIEKELQVRYIKEYYEDLTFTDKVIELYNFQPKPEKLISEKQKNLALAKYDLIRCWEEYKAKQKELKITSRKANVQFIEHYNTGLLYPEIYKILKHVGIGALYRWKSLIAENKDWTLLVGNYKYSSNGTFRTKLSEVEIQIFLKLLLSPNQFSIGKSISLTKHILSEKGIENIPNDVTFRRYANWYKTNNFDKWTLARDGAKALKDKVSPYILRDTSFIDVGQVLFADGHTLNFQVINPFTGKPCRATLIGFFDWKSGGLVGYDIDIYKGMVEI